MQRIADKNHIVIRIKDNTLYQSVIEKEFTDKNSETIIKDEIILFISLAAQKAGLSGIKLRRTAIYIEKDDWIGYIDHQSIRLEYRHHCRII
jgi:hypothetical protein